MSIAAALAALAAGASAASAAAPQADLSAFSCVHAVQPLMRGLQVTAVMRPIPGTLRLEMRFQLLESARPHGRYRVIPGPNLGHWVSPSDPGLGRHPGDVWRVVHPIVGLSAPAYYRLRVNFRWVELSNRPLATQTLQTPICHQLELRPDLAAGALTIAAAAKAGQDIYSAPLRNRGATAAGPFSVALALSDGTTRTATVARIGPRGARRLRLRGPACTPGSTVTLTLDPGDLIDDYERANNTVTATCPSPGPTTPTSTTPSTPSTSGGPPPATGTA